MDRKNEAILPVGGHDREVECLAGRGFDMSYFQEAKAHFLASHQHPVNQALHHITNLLAIAALPFLVYDWRLSVACLVVGQILAQGGHAFVEKNEPAFRQYPGVVILASLAWSFENGFGLRQLWPTRSRG
jgi:hypothetical protein